MELIKQGFEVLYIWSGQNVAEIEVQVTEIKKIANVKLENAERLSMGDYSALKLVNNAINCLFTASYNKSSFDIILVNISSTSILNAINDESAKLLLNLVKPKGHVVISSPKSEELETQLVLTGFVNVSYNQANGCE
jgi:hypothetical protein